MRISPNIPLPVSFCSFRDLYSTLLYSLPLYPQHQDRKDPKQKGLNHSLKPNHLNPQAHSRIIQNPTYPPPKFHVSHHPVLPPFFFLPLSTYRMTHLTLSPPPYHLPRRPIGPIRSDRAPSNRSCDPSAARETGGRRTSVACGSEGGSGGGVS